MKNRIRLFFLLLLIKTTVIMRKSKEKTKIRIGVFLIIFFAVEAAVEASAWLPNPCHFISSFSFF